MGMGGMGMMGMMGMGMDNLMMKSMMMSQMVQQGTQVVGMASGQRHYARAPFTLVLTCC